MEERETAQEPFEVIEADGVLGETGARRLGAANLRMVGRVLAVVISLLASIVCAVPLREHFTQPETYAATVSTLDEKKGNVTALIAASTVASASVTLMPDDVGTPIAERLMDLSSNLMIVLAILYLEKYLLTVFGFVTFGILLPVAFICLACSIALHGRQFAPTSFSRIAQRLAAIGMVLMLTVPSGVMVTDMIDQTYDTSVSVEAAQDVEEANEQTNEEEKSPLEFLTSIPGEIVEGVTGIAEDVLNRVNLLVEGAVVLIVTSCLIPLLTLLFFLWMANVLLNIDVGAPRQAIAVRTQRLLTLNGRKASGEKSSVA